MMALLQRPNSTKCPLENPKSVIIITSYQSSLNIFILNGTGAQRQFIIFPVKQSKANYPNYNYQPINEQVLSLRGALAVEGPLCLLRRDEPKIVWVDVLPVFRMIV